MAKKFYGNLSNRIEEGHIYGTDTITEGMDITMYMWSDRNTHYVTRVIDQKHIFTKPYHVCADHDKSGGMGHQDWMYFKTTQEYFDYLAKHGLAEEGKTYTEPKEREWVFHHGKWRDVSRWTLADYEALDDYRKFMVRLTDKDIAKLKEGKEVVKYHELTGNVSFNVRDHYHDWEF